MQLQKKMNKLREGTAKQAPKEALEVMHRATEDLKNSGIMDRTVKVGDRAPDFTLRSAYGESVSLGELIAKGPVVISFFRGKW